MEKIIAGGLTQEQIDRLKKKHGQLTLITVKPKEKGGKEIHFWFKKPDKKTLSAVTKLAERDSISAMDTYFKNCLVKGDSSLVDDVEIFQAVAPHLERLVEERETVVKNF